VSVMAGATTSSLVASSGMYFYFDYAPPTNGEAPYQIGAGASNLSISSQYSRWMPDVALPCCLGPPVTNSSDANACALLCETTRVTDSCMAWTFQAARGLGGGPGRCMRMIGLSNTAQTLWRPPQDSPGSTSGVLEPSNLLGGRHGSLQLSPHDTTLSLRVFVDNVMAEAFWQGGRMAMTRQAGPITHPPTIVLHATDDVVVQRADVWQVGGIWVEPAEVLRAPRSRGVEDGVEESS